MNEVFKDYEEAVGAAKRAARRLAEKEARRRGAMGELSVTVQEDRRITVTRTGSRLSLGAEVTGVATGRLG